MKLTESEYRALVVHSPVLLWRAGLDAKCDYFNDTWLKFTGRSLEEEQGDAWAKGVHPADLDRCVNYYLEHFQRREAFEMEYRLRRYDGVYRWIFDRGAPFYGDTGAFAGFIGSCIDIDDRRRAQEEHEARGERALASAQGFEQWVLGIVGHDIRNPLGAITTAHQLLVANPGDSESVRRNAQRIGRAADRIKHMVNDLLDLTRERRGGIPIAMEPIEIASVCRDVIDELRVTAPSRTITFACQGLTAGTCDPHRIAQAVSNLVGNAIQHGLANTPVDASLVGDDRQVVFEVHNDGEIPAEKRATLFTAFQARKTELRDSSGLGLGLYIANAIAEAHGGGISVASSAEGGTKFSMRVPRKPPEFRPTSSASA